MSIILSQEEIANAAYRHNELYVGGVLEYTRRPDADISIARAQAQHLMKELKEKCPHTVEGVRWLDKRECPICWQAIWDEVFKEKS